MEQIKPGVWLIYGENKGRFPYAHSLYLDAGGGVLIDSGAGRELDRLPGKVERVLLSHYHRDHVSGNDLFPEASFSIHQLDAPGVESVEGFFRLSGINHVFKVSFWEYVQQSGFKSTAVDTRLEEGDRIDLGSLTLRVIHTPGHTPGHCAFLIEEYETIFAADIDLTTFGPWYGNITSDPDLFRRSIRRIREMNPSLLMTSHSNPVEDKVGSKLAQYEAVIERRDQTLCTILRRSPLTLEQLVDRKPFFRRHPHPENLYRFFERNMIKKHLESLERRGLVLRPTAGEEEGLYEAV